MRKETKTVVSAFLKNEEAKAARTHTNGRELFLFNNRIAWHNSDGVISMTLAGHPTMTTRDRLNGLCVLAGQHQLFSQRRGEQFFTDPNTGMEREIDSDEVVNIPYPTR